MTTLNLGPALSAALALTFALALTVGPAARADTPKGDYADSAAGQKLIERLKREKNIPKATTRKLLAEAKYKPGIIAKMRKPAEKTLTWADYRPIFVQSKRARQGAAYINAHRKLFEKAQAKYGVPAYMIAAILGVETRYGRYIGKDRVLDALSTLAFDYPERSTFFTKELGEFIALCLKNKLDCTHDVGSYAGAMGLAQFMPSSYAAYAVDGNGDGRRDLWHEPADIIDSVANYLAQNGWQRGESIAQPATLAKPKAIHDIHTSTRQPRYRWAKLKTKGVEVANSPPSDARVGLLRFTGPHGPEYWLARHNFFVITTYNSSPLYAMAVYQLGREIEAFTHPAVGS
ncbi:lytic murein transglycosylase B [Salinisphaera sp. LB1]|uniref:lytic murein transglycosylase B n=1 Tax=Salinisphaera sp. LB1 TaxID=2183911 RepID=UPI000D708B1A|nr:lytic murein transglycosylase B [Salinisphaera sp. LB1]AWN14381.1 Membrane-bound lytic murein transglycosylase B precursor [Salinisphaera sp. LB1]